MKKIDSLNLVPFIDIMLVLLVIVLTTASFINTSKLPIAIPQVEQNSSKNQQELKKKNIDITINAKGEYFFNEDLMSLQTLKAQLAILPKDTPIILRGDKGSNLDSFIQIFDILQNLKLKEVYVLVEEKKKN
ncbi:ExbD/TolR family protein [Helicobacter anatolicus]|uniref:ExbD/TolR family protein n=1 Tax=Helicobacter anatolicus TaxID=2905874 RepID=UPI001E3574A9|nr:biopolymer transporter ExbD [Helicobacter anatolicus]MCE3036816.1 biopolymer transporter ExbD [Helicobacter anatolicus]MCE3038340.1 biopolymer transporter ExbD [Helicobacter anatolicus]MCE3039210.1 biopolymer transporter ExbD [Helicobacter anatolicus]